MPQSRARPVRIVLLALALAATTALVAPAVATPASGLEAKLLASDGDEWDAFGWSVAIDGDTVLAGSPFDDGAEYDSGSAYVYRRAGSGWSQEAKLVPADGAWDGMFGLTVALQGDLAVVGAPGDDDNGDYSGSAYVFRRSGTVWAQEAKLLAPDGAEDDGFGISVAVSGDTVLVGAPWDTVADLTVGSAYVFRHLGSEWSLEAKLVPADGVDWGDFGISVALQGDLAVIGSASDDVVGYASGSAHVYRRAGSAWAQEAKLVPSDAAEYDLFGRSVALDGDTVLVGSDGGDDHGFSGGSAYVFRSSGSAWSQEAKLLPQDGAAGDHFGISVAVDGDLAMVGAFGDAYRGAFSGSAHVFERAGTTWTHQAKVVPPQGAANDYFGWAVALDGQTAVVGSDGADAVALGSGAAWVYSPDADGDGVADTIDNCPLPNPDQANFDGDEHADACDDDDDNDGVPDEDDTFPYDGSEWADADGDGIGDNADPDDDNDGIDDGYFGNVYDDPAGDVTLAPSALGTGGALGVPGAAVCNNPRVDITRFATSANADEVVLRLTFAGAEGPSCLGAEELLAGTRETQVTLGWWREPAFLRVTDSSLRGTGCLAFGEHRSVHGLQQFEARCVRTETPTTVTYTLDPMARVTSGPAGTVDIRTLDFGDGTASAFETALDSTRTAGLRFADENERPASRLP